MPIPFKVLESGGVRSGHDLYEEGNTYREHRVSDAEVNALHEAGLIEIEGRDNNRRDPKNVVLVVQDVTISAANPGV